MANPSMTDEEFQLRRRARHRLIGAVTLVTGLVVFLPMVLDNEPRPVAEDIAISIPSQDAKPAKPTLAPAPKSASPAQPVPAAPQAGEPAAKMDAPPVRPLTVLPGGQAPQPAQPVPAETAKAEPAKPEKPAEKNLELVKIVAKPAPVATPPAAEAAKPPARPEKPTPSEPAKPAPKDSKPAAPVADKAKPAAKPAENAAPAQNGFVVRLGAFSKPENAKQLKAKLTSMGVRNYSDVLNTASGDKIRVRAGVFANRREAEMVRERLKAVDIVGDVVPKP